MPKQVSPYYSKESKVYHVYSVCSSGKAVKKKVKGQGGRKLCKACRDIKAGKRTH